MLALAVGLVLNGLSGSIVFFNSPTDVAEKHIAAGTRIRIGGLVKEGSVQRGDNLRVRFEVTDGKSSVRTCFAKGRAWSQKASWNPAERLTRIPCWPSMMSVICRAKWSTH